MPPRAPRRPPHGPSLNCTKLPFYAIPRPEKDEKQAITAVFVSRPTGKGLLPRPISLFSASSLPFSGPDPQKNALFLPRGPEKCRLSPLPRPFPAPSGPSPTPPTPEKAPLLPSGPLPSPAGSSGALPGSSPAAGPPLSTPAGGPARLDPLQDRRRSPPEPVLFLKERHTRTRGLETFQRPRKGIANNISL